VGPQAFSASDTVILRGMPSPIVPAIIGSFMLGDIASVTVVSLVRNFWVRRQYDSLKYLERVCERLVQLNSANINFMRCVTNAEE
jgi:hypothetical protein